jgi:hypothetical protein
LDFDFDFDPEGVVYRFSRKTVRTADPTGAEGSAARTVDG